MPQASRQEVIYKQQANPYGFACFSSDIIARYMEMNEFVGKLAGGLLITLRREI